jgi:Holliday junction DNA helicase RuvB
VVDTASADAALELLAIDDLGLDRLDREILEAICTKFDGGPVGLSTLAITVSEEQDTIEDVYEPYLLQCGFIKRTPRGRVATTRAWAHLGLEPPVDRDAGLF